MSEAETANPAAVTHRVLTAPIVAMSTPPMPGPTRNASPHTAS